ncbi:MAG: DUF3540 domain-containing protein [Pseudomonadota bacterium]
MALPHASNEPESLSLAMGEIKGRSGQRYLVLSDQGLSPAHRSAGCLLEPEIGDQVLLLLAEDQPLYILHVLRRGRQENTARISVEAPELKVASLSLTLSARDFLKLEAADLKVEALRGQARCGELSYQGGCLTARIGHVKTWANFLETRAERLIERVQRSYRQVEEFEETKVGRLRLLVRDLFFLGSRNTTLKSEEQTKIDGEKIQLG